MKPYYEDGSVTIYHGDCREVLPTLTGDAILTDPPYGVGFNYGDEYDDDPAGWPTLIAEALPLMLSSAPVAVITCGVANLFRYPEPIGVLAWAKPGAMGRNRWGGANNWEPILVYGKRKFDVDLVTVSIVPNDHAYGHPCPKPLKLFTRLVALSTDVGECVIDPFMGSGTTLKAAKELGRRTIGIDQSEKYCEIAARRCAQEVLDLGAA